MAWNRGGMADAAQTDPAMVAVLQAGKRFERLMPFVDISGLAPDQILEMLDPNAVEDLRNGRVDQEEFCDGVLAFLVRAALLKTNEAHIPYQNVSLLLKRADGPVDLSEADMEKAKDELWCTIWPICSTGI